LLLFAQKMTRTREKKKQINDNKEDIGCVLYSIPDCIVIVFSQVQAIREF